MEGREREKLRRGERKGGKVRGRGKVRGGGKVRGEGGREER